MSKIFTKRLVVFLAVFITSLLLVACGDKNKNASKDNASKDPTEDQFDKGNKDDKESDEPETISIMLNLHTPQVPNDKILNLLEEKTNVILDIDWVPDNNYNEKLNTAFATSTLPNVVGVGFQQMGQFREAIRDDQFWEIGPYLKEFENLNKLKEPIIKNTMIDGKIYGLYKGTALSRQGIIYRKDWADNLGLPTPTTTEDFFEMARAFTEDDPDGNGKDDTIGLTDRGDLIYGAFKTISSWFGTPNNWGEKDGKLLPEFMFPEYVETMEFIKELRDNTYMNQDFPVTSKDDQQAMFKNGTAGIYVGSMGDVGSIYNDAVDLNLDVEYDVQNYIEGPNGEYNIWAIPGFGSMVLFPKSSVESEEKLLKILEFHDYLMTPEISNLINWGIEGEHYTVVDGKVKVTEEQEKFDTEVKPFQSLGIGEPETRGSYEGYHEYDVKLKSDDLIADNDNYLIHDPTINLESETFVKDADRLQEIINDATYNYMLGEIDEDGFNKEVEKWKDQGGAKMIEEFNASK